MAERHEGKGGKIISMTVKRARRVQEKMMQKLGKSDQTRDEVFEEFVNNFHKQNAAAVKLQKEMMKYMNNIRVLYQNTKSMSETLRELYEDDWEGCEKQRDLMEQRILLWEDLLTSLASRTVEPMTNYISRFSDIKGRIHKRERKVVDYDLRRRELEQARSKAKVNDQKIQQAEETHMLAKQLYDEITDELYEELPTLYDSRIQFYAQIFQSIAAAEAKFHSEVSKIDEDLARVMDGLAAQSATGVHSTKKQRSVINATPKLLSRPAEEGDSEDDSEDLETHPMSHSPSLNPPPTNQTSPTPTSDDITQNSVDPSESVSPTPAEAPTSKEKPEIPPPFRASGDQEATSPQTTTIPRQEGAGEGGRGHAEIEGGKTPDPGDKEPAPLVTPATEDVPPSDQEETVKTPPPKPAPLVLPPADATPTQPAMGETGEQKEERVVQPPDNLLYRVVATHQYQGEDEDELTFEKGAVIYVIPYEDPEDEEEGWCMGILQGSGCQGIFPENFTKKND